MSEKSETRADIQALEKSIAQSAASGVQSSSVDGVSVTQMSLSDRVNALKELKKSQVARFPMMMAKWK